jgi:hypothetical protein
MDRDVIKNVYGYPCKVPLSLSDFTETFLTDFQKNTQISRKSVQWEGKIP